VRLVPARQSISRSGVSLLPMIRHTGPAMQTCGARELNVDAVVEGVIERSGDQVRITAQLIYAPTDRHLWDKSYERQLRDVLALQDEVARNIAEEVRVKLTLRKAVADERSRNRSRCLRGVSEGALLLEQANGRGAREEHRILRAGDRERPDAKRWATLGWRTPTFTWRFGITWCLIRWARRQKPRAPRC
jgi:hypothetical protein